MYTKRTIEKRYKDYTIGGKGRFGVWPSELEEYRELPLTLRKGIASLARASDHPKIMDAGCGNGKMAASIWLHLHQEGIHPHGVLVDKQQSAVNDAKNTFRSYGIPTNNIRFIAEDLLNLGNRSVKLDAIICRWVLHWLKPEEISTVLANMHSILAPNGLLWLEVATIYNLAALGPKKEKLKDICKATRNGKSDEVYRSFHPGFGKIMSFFTRVSLRKSLEVVGFQIKSLNSRRNDFPNGLIGRPELINVLARK